MAVTTKTIKSAGGDYTSLSGWEAGQQKAITAGDSEEAECYSISDTTPFDIDGWTTGATAYIRIYTPAAERHAGVWTSAKYNLSGSVNGWGILNILEEYVRVEGIQVENTNVGTDAQHIILVQPTGTADIRVDSCISKGGRYGLTASGNASCVVKAWNCLFYGGGGGGATVKSSASCYLYSCTTYGGTDGLRIEAATTTVAKNCYARTYPAGWTKTTCASEDTTGSTGLQSIAYNTTNFTNVTAGSENLHIPTGSALKDVGTDTSGDAAPLNFTVDIDGETRTGTWDVGADEFVSAGSTAGKLVNGCLVNGLLLGSLA